MFEAKGAGAFERRMGFPFGRRGRENSRADAHARSEAIVEFEATSGRWLIFDSGPENFSSSFSGVLHGLSLETYVRNRFGKEDIIGMVKELIL